MASVAEESVLPVRLRFAPWCMPGADAADLAELIEAQGRGGRHWLVGGVKFFMDGTVEGGTAWLEHADCHGRGTDAFWPDPDDYGAAVRTLHAAGVRTATHAIGDAAVRHVLDTVAALGPGGRGRHRVEHIETAPDDLPPRFAEAWPPRCSPRTPPARAPTAATSGPAGSARTAPPTPGGCATCGTPAPPSPSAPTGPSPTTTSGRSWPPHAPRAARPPGGPAWRRWRGCTTHAARAAGESDHAGRVAPGFRADLTALAVDPAEAPADELADAPVLLTVTDGHLAHRAR
ncbi:putative amidohydrolase YtcJ [Streptomyces phaeoluteigriseus]